MNYIFHKAALIALLSLSSSIAQSEQITHPKNVYTEPELIKGTPPNYLPHELEDANAGAVEVIFMVDKNGKTFEPILGYTSKPQFGTYALNAIKNYRYKPATLNGKPVDSVKRLRVDFAVQDQDDQVSQRFRKHYRTASKELGKENPNKNKIKKRIKSMADSSHMSPYSYRHLNSIKHHYASLFENEQAQIDSIHELLLFESRTKEASAALGEELRTKMRRRLVELLIKTGQYGEATAEYKNLKRIDPEAKALYKEAFKKLTKFVTVTN